MFNGSSFYSRRKEISGGNNDDVKKLIAIEVEDDF